MGDTDGLVGLNKTSELKEDYSDNCLVRVTNQLGESATVKVYLAESSETLGGLKTDPNGTVEGNSVEFSLNDQNTEAVYMDVDNGTSGETVEYGVNSSGSGIGAYLVERSTPVKQTAGKTCE